MPQQLVASAGAWRGGVCFALACVLSACTASAHTRARERDAEVEASGPQDAGSGVSRTAESAARTETDQASAATDAGADSTLTAASDAGSSTAALGPYELVRTRSWPGGGVQLTVMSIPGPACELPTAEPRLLRADGSELPVERTALAETGITALVITPSPDPDDHAAQLEAARALIAGLPADERIGIWLGSAQLPLVCELSERREHVLSRLSAIAAQSAAPIAGAALLDLQRRLRKVGGPYATPARALIGVGTPPLTAAEGGESVRFLRLGRFADSSSDLFGWNEPANAARAGSALAAALLRSRQQGFRLGACDVGDAEPLELQLGEQRFAVRPEPQPSGLAVSCDSAAAARDEYPFPDQVSLVLDEAQLAEHDRLAEAKDESDFSAAIAFGAGEPSAVRAHFRGQTTLDCARKSYSVHFSDNAARRLMARANTNEFILLSLCADKGWFRQALSSRVMGRLGLFSLEHRFVKLRVADRELGVYLMLEKPDEALRDQQSKLAGLVRRRYDPAENPPESEYPKPKKDPEGAARAVSEYQAVVALIDTTEPSALKQALSAKLDLDLYLHWLAVMSIFQSGDYADEVFFFASDEAAAANGGWYFRPLGWDSDDLFAACHHGGKYSLKDPAGLLYCLEGKLDRALLVSPEIYARFVAEFTRLSAGPLALEEVLRDLTQVRTALSALLVDDPVCVGTGLVIDAQPATCDKLQPWLASTIDEFARLLGVRSRGLAERVRKWQAVP